MRRAGVGLRARLILDEDGDLAVMLTPRRLGRMSRREREARDLVTGELAEGTPEMAATLVERLAALVPVACMDCGEETDAAGLVRALREGAELS